MKITTPKAHTADKGISTLLLGKVGAGKTTFIGTMPQPLLIIDIDDGLQALRDRDDIDVYSATSISELKSVVQELKAGCDYASIALDSLTSLQDMSLRETTNGNAPSWEDWSALADNTIGIMRDLLSIREAHTVFSVLVVDEVEKQPDGAKQVVQVPYMRPAVSKYAYAAVDVVGLIKQGFQGKRAVELTPSPDFANLKARSPMPVSKLTQVDFNGLEALLKKSGEKVEKSIDKPPSFSKIGNIGNKQINKGG